MKTIENITTSYMQWIENSGNQNRVAYFIWHGGEPLICGIPYYEAIKTIQDRFTKQGRMIENAFQTNGTLINQNWISLFQLLDASVGISVDGPKTIHDLNRRYVNSNSSYDDTMRGVRLLARAGLSYSAISVVSNNSVSRLNEALDFFVDEGFGVVDFIPSFYHNDPISIDAESYANAMIGLYDYWKEQYDDKIYIRFLGDVEGKLRNDIDSIGCELAGCCGENFSVHVDGDVYPCECVSTFPEFRIGNINDEAFENIISAPSFSKWKQCVNSISHKCTADCDSFGICRGGCFNRRYCGDGTILQCDPLCEARYSIISHIKQFGCSVNGN
jgi:uncharacterized protein